jgi:hypothetical protein
LRSLKKILLFLRNAYSLDVRALGIMRIAIAIVILADLVIRAADMEAHYMEDGIWPSDLIRHSGWKNGYWTFHDLLPSHGFTIFLFVLHFILAAFVLIGYRTRICTLLLLVFEISLHNRNIFILQAGDDLLRLILLWGIFLPWGARYSLDARNQKQMPGVPWIAGFGYLILIASVYLFSVMLKTGSDWHADNSALYYALSLDQLRLPLGDVIYHQETFLKAATRAVYLIELIIGVLIFIPTRKQVCRTIAFFLIVLLHISIGLTLYVGLFFIIGCVSAIGLLPGELFTKIEKRFTATGRVMIRKKNKTWILVANNISILIIVTCLTINLSTTSFFDYRLQHHVAFAANALRLDQYWGMFSPQVLRRDGWLVYYGQDSVGRQWDLRLNQDYVDFSKPPHVVSMYKSDRWRKLAENMQDARFTFLRPLYCKYILKKWNERHPRRQMVLLNLYFIEKTNLPGYKTTVPQKILYSVCNVQ